MLPYDELAVFAAVAEAGSLTAAARRLGLSTTAVSEQLRRLEERLGAVLLIRSTRRLALTEAGRAALDHARAMVAAGEAAAREAERLHREPHGLLRVAAPTTFAPLHLVPLLPAFQAQNPALRIEFALAAAPVDLTAEGVDVAVRIGRLGDSRLTAKRLGSSRGLLVAAPAYLARRGTPQAPEALAAHDHLAFTPLGRRGLIRLQGPGGRRYEAAVEPLFASDAGEALLAAAIAGMGLAALPGWMVALPLAEGLLQRVLPGWGGAAVPIHALHAGGRRPPAKVRRFVDFLATRLAERLP